MTITISIGSLPGRKRPAISLVDGSVLYPVAYFRDDESYERFKAAVSGANTLRWSDYEEGE